MTPKCRDKKSIYAYSFQTNTHNSPTNKEKVSPQKKRKKRKKGKSTLHSKVETLEAQLSQASAQAVIESGKLASCGGKQPIAGQKRQWWRRG